MSEEQYIPLPLPSKGLAYLNIDMDKIKIRPFKGKDESLIAEITSENLKKKFVTIIKNVIRGIEPKDLTSGDVKYILLWEAINSYTQDYPVKLVCENCLQEVQITCDLGKINNVELPDNFKQPFDQQLSGKMVQLRLLTLGDEIAAIDWARQGKSVYLYGYARSIVDENINIIEKIKMLEDMSTKDLNEIRKFHTKYSHGPDMKISYTCPLCDYEGKTVLPFRADELLSFSE